MENPAPTSQHPHVATLRSDDVPIFISPMSRFRRDLINEILRYKAEATSLEVGERRDETEGRQRRESRDREHFCICISFLEHLIIQDFMVVMNINML